MNTTNSIDKTRNDTLNKIESREKMFNYSILFIALYELALIILLVSFTNFSDSTHVVIFIASFLVYGTLGLTMIAFNLYLNSGIERILKSIALLEHTTEQEPSLNEAK